MRAHVLGNGESWVHFKKVAESDFVVGCNKPNTDVDATVIVDLRFFYKLLDRIEPLVISCPIITNEKCKKQFQAKNRNTDKIILKEVYSPPIKFKAISSAHIATLWLIENDYDEIHIWGCDSLKTNSMESTTDIIVDGYYKNEDNQTVLEVINNWKENWDMIVKEYPNSSLIFHNEE